MRITKKLLQAKIDTISRMTYSPLEYATKTDQGFLCNIGHFHLSQAYGGYCLQRICTDGGGVTSPLHTGHIPARELALALDGFIAALQFTKHD